MKRIGMIIALLMVVSLLVVPLAACQGPQGETGPTGPAGPQGEQGDQGPQGAPASAGGAQGEQGEAGPAGADATMWYTGNGTPATATGIDGDLYYNEANGDVYQKVSGNWSWVANLKGPEGKSGPMGSQGPQGESGPNATIVVCSGEGANDGKAITYFNDSTGDFDIRVYGSNFVQGDHVHLTICENDTILAQNLSVIVCGTIGVWGLTLLESAGPGVIVPEGVHSVKVYVDDGDGLFGPEDELWACWPLEVQWTTPG